MQTVADYLRENDVNDLRPCESWAKVFKQAIQHTRRLDRIDLLDDNRPNESDAIKTYRNKIARRLTREGVYKFIAKKSRIYKNSGVNIDKNAISETLREWLDTKPFVQNGRRLTFAEYMYEIISMRAIEDANALHVAFPINPKNAMINPSAPVEIGGMTANESIGILPMVVPSKQRRLLNDDIVIFCAGEWEFGENDKHSEPYYFMADRFDWFIHYPVRYERGKPVYETTLWYNHNSGIVPAQSLAGMPTMDENDQVYNESFLSSYFEYADEFVTAFSDSQAVRVQHSYPKTVIDQIPCPANCRNGKVVSLNADGTENVDKCTVCGGAGIITDLSPYNVIRRPQHQIGQPENASNNPVIEYVVPPDSILKFGYDVAFDLLEKGKKSIGLDLLESLSESGVAKEARLEDLIDMLTMIGNAEIYFMETFLAQCESLLVINPNDRIMPKIKHPESYAIKTQQMLLDAAKNTIPSDRVQKAKEYFKASYKGQDTLIRVMSLAHDYAPLLGVEGSELQTRLNFAYTPDDLVKADRAVWAFTKLSETYDNFMLMDDDRLFALADELIAPYLPDEPLPLYNPAVGGELPDDQPTDDDGNNE